MNRTTRQDRLLQVLRYAYLERERTAVNPFPLHRVMEAVHGLSRRPHPAGVMTVIGMCAWKRAPVICAMIVVCVLVLLNFRIIPDADWLQVFFHGVDTRALLQ